jgi:hypothetical protein
MPLSHPGAGREVSATSARHSRGAIVDNGEDAEAVAIGELVRREVALVRRTRHRFRRSGSHHPLATVKPARGEMLFPIELLMIDYIVVPFMQHAHAPITEPVTAFMRNGPHTLAKIDIASAL